MSTNSHPPLRKRNEAEISTPAPDDDYRKKRRNRMTQSCVSCHAAKRMCNRQRPSCLRCTTLGLTGLCVYEVDDPAQKDMQKDETFHLRNRVSELESVIREMKNKPQPRWVRRVLAMKEGSKHHSSQIRGKSSYPELRGLTAPSESDTATTSSSSNAHGIPPQTTPSASSFSPKQPPLPNFLSVDSLTPLAASKTFKNLGSLAAPGSESTDSSRISEFINDAPPHPQSNISTRSWAENSQFLSNSTVPSSATFNGTDSENGIPSSNFQVTEIIQADEKGSAVTFDYQDTAVPRPYECPPNGNVIVYNIIFNLSLSLRKTAQVLGQLSEHFPGSDCALFAKVVELNFLASTALVNAMASTEQREGWTPASDKLYDNEPVPSTNTSTLPVSLQVSSESFHYPHHYPQNWSYYPLEG